MAALYPLFCKPSTIESPTAYQIIRLETPTAADAEVLSQISKAAKAYWGYPKAWLRLWDADLTFSVDYLQAHPVFVVQSVPKGNYLGVCVLEENLPYLWVEHLWISPNYIGMGYGTALLEFALQAEIKREHRAVKVVADPNAAPFYRARGFEVVGYHPSQPQDRKLPVMEQVL